MVRPPETYFARRVRQSDTAMRAAKDRGSRLAHAQLKSAYEALDRPGLALFADSDRQPPCPSPTVATGHEIERDGDDD